MAANSPGKKKPISNQIKPVANMPSFLSFLFLLLSFFIHGNNGQFHYCLGPNFTPNTTYHSNLNLLFSNLSSTAPGINGFYSASAGRSPNDTVYGLFQCRGDVDGAACRACVANATRSLATLYCPVSTGAVIWYDECTLRYENQSFFSVLSTEPRLYAPRAGDRIGSGVMNNQEVMMSLLNSTAAKAAAAANGTLFWSDYIASGNQAVFTMAQCTGDLSAETCRRCLGEAIQDIPICCSGKQGGRVLFPSCYVGVADAPPTYSEVIPAPGLSIPQTESVPPVKSRSPTVMLVVAVTVPITIVILFVMGWCFLRKITKKKHKPANLLKQNDANHGLMTVESLQYDLNTIDAATNNFSEDNKLGRGGFGEVYKGVLANGQQIAVKRLSKGSSQGSQEFKNEVLLVAKLQHRHLVTLLGFCIEAEEKILIYEYIPNKSLDYFLFDPDKQVELNWSRRYKIISGIVRGILYLHEYSRLKVIHRDLKASNILLDEDFNPKISDFGLARIIEVDQAQASTCRIVGTYGYMSPEYAMHGHFSIKSDVYSFGVLLLEIISGKRNSSFYTSNLAQDILNYAWELWRNETPLELLDPNLKDSHSTSEVLRCIHIGLLCVQEDHNDRPSMTSIIHMLNNGSATLPSPNHPAFICNRDDIMTRAPYGPCGQELLPCSTIEMSTTRLFPR